MSSTLSSTPYEAVQTISPEALLQRIRSDSPQTILDVRDRAQTWSTGAIAGARVLPKVQLSSRIDELANLRSTLVVVVSQAAHPGAAAVLELRAAGFTEVLLLEGGMDRWLALGYPVDERRDAMPSSRP